MYIWSKRALVELQGLKSRTTKMEPGRIISSVFIAGNLKSLIFHCTVYTVP